MATTATIPLKVEFDQKTILELLGAYVKVLFEVDELKRRIAALEGNQWYRSPIIPDPVPWRVGDYPPYSPVWYMPNTIIAKDTGPLMN